jgi:hypothetical protein
MSQDLRVTIRLSFFFFRIYFRAPQGTELHEASEIIITILLDDDEAFNQFILSYLEPWGEQPNCSCP